MQYALPLVLVLIIAMVSTGPSLADDDNVTNEDLRKFHDALINAKCASTSSDAEVKKFENCYKATREAADEKDCVKNDKDKHNPCSDKLDKKKMGNAKGVQAACKLNSINEDDVKKQYAFSRCVFKERVKSCPNSTVKKEYQKSLEHAKRAKDCVNKE